MRTLQLFGLASAIGLVAAGFAAQSTGLLGGGNSVPVVVLARNVDAGAPIAAFDLKVIQWPENSVPPGALRDPQQVVGRYVRQPMITGELVLDGRLSPLQSRGGLASFIAPGKRAITVQVNEVVAVAGFALPGSFVDVLVSAKDASDQAFSRTVLQRVKVLAAAQDTQSDPSKPKVVNAVTLELTPEESEKLDLARNVGTLSLVLRNEFDQAPAESRGARVRDLMDGGAGERSAQVNPAGRAGVVQPAKPVAAAPKTVAHTNTSSTQSKHEVTPSSRVVEMRGLQQEGK